MQKIAVNKKASYNYQITEKYEAGIVLTGSEVKSLRNSTGSIKEAYIIEKNQELWLTNCHIKQYFSSNEKNHSLASIIDFSVTWLMFKSSIFTHRASSFNL